MFDAKLPGSWLADLSHVDLSRVKVGKDKWVELDGDLLPSRYLDGWYTRLRDAHLATMADLGVHADMEPADFLAAMDGYQDRDPDLAIVVSAIKATVKGGIGRLRERPRGEGWRPGQPWRALSRPDLAAVHPPGSDADAYKQRNSVERCINRLKQWRGLATRTDRLAIAYQAALHLAAILIRARR
ncbi:hypothetical protein C3492_27280 [Streptomyces sp. Ru62]|nr:hypothetical protein C3492_27280 [Streptomyces sp. Ru62]